MPEHLRALIVILFLAGLVFSLAQPLARDLVDGTGFSHQRNLWFGLTLVAFLAHNFWLYIFLCGIVVALFAKREQNPIALFFFLLFLIPNVAEQISGFGVVDHLIELGHVRLLTLVILLPALLTIKKREDPESFRGGAAGKVLAGYLLLVFVLQFWKTTVTDGLRDGFYLFVDVFLPYYVASRLLKDLADFREAAFGFMVAAMLQGIFGIFEYARHWQIYSALIGVFGMYGGDYTSYLGRGGYLRARAAAGHPIALGYVMVVAIGLYLFVSDAVRGRLRRWLSGSLLVGGLYAPLSRGPWVGAAVLLVAFIATGRFAIRRLAMLGLAAILALSLMTVLPGGDKVIDLLPFIGTVERSNIDYRSRLMENSAIVIQRHPWFGSKNYLDAPEMKELRQGQGIIDVVNTYYGVALESGLVGLGLFVGFFFTVLLGVYKAMRLLPDRDDEMYLLGRSLFATLVGILIIIFTVSSITIIPVVYWSVAGLGVAYARMVSNRKALA